MIIRVSSAKHVTCPSVVSIVRMGSYAMFHSMGLNTEPCGHPFSVIIINPLNTALWLQRYEWIILIRYLGSLSLLHPLIIAWWEGESNAAAMSYEMVMVYCSVSNVDFSLSNTRFSAISVDLAQRNPY